MIRENEMVAARMDSPPAVPKRCHLVGFYIHIALDHLLSKLETSRVRPSQWRGLLAGLSRKSRCVGANRCFYFHYVTGNWKAGIGKIFVGIQVIDGANENSFRDRETLVVQVGLLVRLLFKQVFLLRIATFATQQ